jgi:prepilin-type N-terminal cleavage/methylation domain-containing protein
MIKREGGFTLIELLVVIAIIGLLSSVVFASLSTARAKGRIANMQSSMKSFQTDATLCLDDGASALNSPAAGAYVCGSAGGKYPSLPAGWSYVTNPAPNLTLAGGNFSVASSGDGKVITCTVSGCATQ